MITPPFALQACPPGSVTRTGPQARGLLCDDYFTRRHTLPPAAGLLVATSFSSSPVRLTENFASTPSASGNNAPSAFRVRVLSASLTDHVPKLATTPCAKALYRS